MCVWPRVCEVFAASHVWSDMTKLLIAGLCTVFRLDAWRWESTVISWTCWRVCEDGSWSRKIPRHSSQLRWIIYSDSVLTLIRLPYIVDRHVVWKNACLPTARFDLHNSIRNSLHENPSFSDVRCYNILSLTNGDGVYGRYNDTMLPHAYCSLDCILTQTHSASSNNDNI